MQYDPQTLAAILQGFDVNHLYPRMFSKAGNSGVSAPRTSPATVGSPPVAPASPRIAPQPLMAPGASIDPSTLQGGDPGLMQLAQMLYNQNQMPQAPSAQPIDTQPHGFLQRLGVSLHQNPIQWSPDPRSSNSANFWGGLASSLGNTIGGRGYQKYASGINAQQAAAQNAQQDYANKLAQYNTTGKTVTDLTGKALTAKQRVIVRPSRDDLAGLGDRLSVGQKSLIARDGIEQGKWDEILASVPPGASKTVQSNTWMEDKIHQSDETGAKYVDGSDVPVSQVIPLMNYAHEQKIPFINKVQKAKLDKIQEIRQNASDMLEEARQFLPDTTDPFTTAKSAAMNTLAAATNQNPALAAWGVKRIPAIQQIVGLAMGPGSGGRINQAEIAAAFNSDIPKITDNFPTAAKRIDYMNMLANRAEEAIISGKNLKYKIVVGKDGIRHLSLGGSYEAFQSNQTQNIEDPKSDRYK